MNNSNTKELVIGIVILVISASSLLIKSIPIIWIGGFIWGGSMIAKALNNKKQYSFRTTEIEKEIITCDNCKQKIRVPKDRQRFINITCPHCKESPFLSLSDRFHRSPRKTKLLWIGGLIFVILVFTYVIFKSGNSVTTPPVTPVVATTITPQKTQQPSIVPTPTNIVSFSNGEFLTKNSYYLQGSGNLEIRNGTNNNAVAKLVSTVTDKSVATVYIGANNTYTLKNISNGSYRLVFNLGHDWDTISKKFTRNSSYSVFEENFDYTTRSSSDGYYYRTFEVTLNPVIGGTAETNDINQEEFSAY
ncbi:MAG TPA: hypothetical protein VJC13_03180 [Candidatus Paceibacterota bacterium]